MCKAIAKAMGKVQDGLHRGIATDYIEKTYGIRAYNPMAELGGDRRTNSFYKPGGKGFAEEPGRTNSHSPAAHTRNIASFKSDGG